MQTNSRTTITKSISKQKESDEIELITATALQAAHLSSTAETEEMATRTAAIKKIATLGIFVFILTYFYLFFSQDPRFLAA